MANLVFCSRVGVSTANVAEQSYTHATGSIAARAATGGSLSGGLTSAPDA